MTSNYLMRAGLLSALAAPLACGGSAPSPEAPSAAARPLVPGEVIDFAFETLSGEVVSGETLRGRVTVVGFIATYDSASQAQAQFLHALLRAHTPRINVAVLVLESPDNRLLVEVFVEAFGLPYPVAFADAATLAGRGPFKGLHHVPSVVVLDAEGREAWRNVGLIERAPLEAAVRAVQQGKAPSAAASSTAP